MFKKIDKLPDINEIQDRCIQYWQDNEVYLYDPHSSKPTFSVDTPPPYVSAAHLHVGHAMSYTQAEIIVRYKRMCGYNTFYPMGFDDNGLPTERFVERKHKINKKKISRSDFRALCIEETQRGAETYELLWKYLGLSVDWRLRYSTIDKHSRKTAQKSFLDLYKKELVYRANEPVLWDTHFETALAQADLDTIERKGTLFDIPFTSQNDEALVISTSRPELLCACVALFYNPSDKRYQHLKGQKAITPIFNQQVPILCCDSVDPSFGTGLMMVCTFGDAEDIAKWKTYKLDTRLSINTQGKMNELAGIYQGLSITEARSKISKDLAAEGLILKKQKITQMVSIGERSGEPVEFMMEPQWFINLLDHTEKFKERSKELHWAPEWMQARLDDWINGLKYDWNISRQRFYGVPFPLWYVKETGEIILAEEGDLPIDPIEDSPPTWAIEKYKGMTIIPEKDVMETWMTSSTSPLINSNWAGSDDRLGGRNIYPMDLRIQGFEIIRTWLFYTLVKSEYHTESLPWRDLMISGWGLNEQGKKISKQDLEKFTDENGFNRYEPFSIMKKYGSDALRYWAASASLGKNLKYNEKDIRDARKTVTKLWNVARLTFMYLDDFDYDREQLEYENRALEDKWIVSDLNQLINGMTTALDRYDFACAREYLHKFFWGSYCDDYLEMIKPRFKESELENEIDIRSAKSTLYEGLRYLLSAFAPFMPFITEEIYLLAGRFGESYASLHNSDWPQADNMLIYSIKDIECLRTVLHQARRLRSNFNLPNRQGISMQLQVQDEECLHRAMRLEGKIMSLINADSLDIVICAKEVLENDVDVYSLNLSIISDIWITSIFT